MLQDLQKVERYIPLLQNLVVRVESANNNLRVSQWTSELKIRWTSVLASSGPFGLAALKYYRVDNLRFELGMMFFLYGGLLRERALEVISTGKVFLYISISHFIKFTIFGNCLSLNCRLGGGCYLV